MSFKLPGPMQGDPVSYIQTHASNTLTLETELKPAVFLYWGVKKVQDSLTISLGTHNPPASASHVLGRKHVPPYLAAASNDPGQCSVNTK